MFCPYCRTEITKSYITTEVICQACYLYTRKGGKIYAIPDPGTLVTTEHGAIVCHICGQAHFKLGNHIASKHKMLVSDYKDYFDLPQRISLASEKYRQKMRAYNTQHRAVVVADMFFGGDPH